MRRGVGLGWPAVFGAKDAIFMGCVIFPDFRADNVIQRFHQIARPLPEIRRSGSRLRNKSQLPTQDIGEIESSPQAGSGSLSRVNSRAGIRAITFDVGGTLLEPWPSVGDIYQQVGADFGLAVHSAERLNRNFIAAWRAKRDFDYSVEAWLELVALTFERPANDLPAGFFERLYARFTEPDAWRIYGDVLPALEMLSKLPIRLAILSNWDDRLRPLLEKLDLLRFFECATISCEVGHAKPAGGIFASASARLELPPGAILHVGDSRREDVEGGRRAGFQAALLYRADGGGDIDSLDKIATLIGASSID